MERKIIIAGGSGFIGRYLANFFVKNKYLVVILSRRIFSSVPNMRHMEWDGKNLGRWTKELEGATAIINLTGKSINCRFTEANKAEILSSRINSVNVIRQAINRCEVPPQHWIQASSIGYYGNTANRVTENSPPGETFLSQVTKQWEDTLFQPDSFSTTKTALRLGIVLGKNGGALKPLELITKLFIGGAAGNGKQFMSWIHIEDVANITNFLITKAILSGPVNLVSPTAIPNAAFMKTLRKVLHRPWSPNAPKLAIKIGAKIMGTEPELILDSSNVYPQKLIELDYSFLHLNLESALHNLLD